MPARASENVSAIRRVTTRMDLDFVVDLQDQGTGRGTMDLSTVTLKALWTCNSHMPWPMLWRTRHCYGATDPLSLACPYGLRTALALAMAHSDLCPAAWPMPCSTAWVAVAYGI